MPLEAGVILEWQLIWGKSLSQWAKSPHSGRERTPRRNLTYLTNCFYCCLLDCAASEYRGEDKRQICTLAPSSQHDTDLQQWQLFTHRNIWLKAKIISVSQLNIFPSAASFSLNFPLKKTIVAPQLPCLHTPNCTQVYLGQIYVCR